MWLFVANYMMCDLVLNILSNESNFMKYDKGSVKIAQTFGVSNSGSEKDYKMNPGPSTCLENNNC